MIEQLVILANEVTQLNCKLILLIGGTGSGKSQLLMSFARFKDVEVLNAGLVVSSKIVEETVVRRRLTIADRFKEAAGHFGQNGLLLIDNIELLFDPILQLNPLDLLKQVAHTRCVVAVWPGDLIESRLSYAGIGHPEHREFAVDGFIPFLVT